MAPTQQMTFGHLEASRRRVRPAGAGMRLAARADAQNAIDAAACSGDSLSRQRELRRLQDKLDEYVDQLGVGAEFQAADFSRWLHEIGEPPDETIIDPRCTGSMFKGLCHEGVLVSCGVRSNAGNKETGYNATPRTVYRIMRLPERPAHREPGTGSKR